MIFLFAGWLNEVEGNESGGRHAFGYDLQDFGRGFQNRLLHRGFERVRRRSAAVSRTLDLDPHHGVGDGEQLRHLHCACAVAEGRFRWPGQRALRELWDDAVEHEQAADQRIIAELGE